MKTWKDKLLVTLASIAVGWGAMVAIMVTSMLISGCVFVTPAIKKQTLLVDCKLTDYVKKDFLMKDELKQAWLDLAEMHSTLVFGAPQVCDPSIFPQSTEVK